MVDRQETDKDCLLPVFPVYYGQTPTPVPGAVAPALPQLLQSWGGKILQSMDNPLDFVFAGNTLRTWLIALLVFAALFFILELVRKVLANRTRTLSQNHPTVPFYDLLCNLAGRTSMYFHLALAFFAASLLLVLPDGIRRALGVITISMIIFQGGLWANSLIDYLLTRRIYGGKPDEPARATTLSALKLVSRAVVWTVVLLLVLDNIPGVQVTTLIASLGITGIAVGLAVQNVLSDLFASLSIALDQPFVIGDSITVGDMSGTVEHIGLKSTRVRSLSGEQLIFSNSDLLASRIRNFKRMERRRVIFKLDLGYDTDPELAARVPALVREIIERQPLVTYDRAHLQTFTDWALRFEVVYYIESSDYNLFMDTQQAVNLEILRSFQEEGIHFAYPTQVVLSPGAVGEAEMG